MGRLEDTMQMQASRATRLLRFGALALMLIQGPAWADGPRSRGHDRVFPATGHVVRTLPSHARPIHWGGVHYRHHGGVWYAPRSYGYAVVRPPVGIWVSDLPSFATAVTIAGIAYLVVNDVYYRERTGGGYEVVAPPVDTGRPSPGTPDRMFVYPRNGQTAERQASDEYECHRWAVSQTGFDPSGAAVGQPDAGHPAMRADYLRAQAACLDGRGYTVR
jgi:hypothetical protein